MTEKTPREQWIAALESGEYEQAYGALRTKNGFCCLGVACDLAVKAGVPIRVETPDEAPTKPGVKPLYRYDGQAGLPPISVREWLGLAGVDMTDMLTDLANRNDSGDSLKQIASLLKTNPRFRW